MIQACGPDVPVEQNPGAVLGAILGTLGNLGRNKVTIIASPGIYDLGAWLEQLIAESTGKNGKGLIPVDREHLTTPDKYGDDRVFVYLRLASDSDSAQKTQLDALRQAGQPVVEIELADVYDLGQEFFRWEVAVASAGAVIGIQPFNQPDVQLAKDLAKKAMEGKAGGQQAPEVAASQRQQLQSALQEWLGRAQAGNYISLQAYLEPTPATDAALEQLRVLLREKSRLATTAGYGPRFLHSTGQLHKGGPNTGLFLQLVDQAATDVAVPETNYTFGQLIRAQAQGDWQALTQRGRRVVRVQLGSNAQGGLAQLLEVARELRSELNSGHRAA